MDPEGQLPPEDPPQAPDEVRKPQMHPRNGLLGFQVLLWTDRLASLSPLSSMDSAQDGSSIPPLIDAVHDQDLERIAELLQGGADVNCRDGVRRCNARMIESSSSSSDLFSLLARLSCIEGLDTAALGCEPRQCGDHPFTHFLEGGA